MRGKDNQLEAYYNSNLKVDGMPHYSTLNDEQKKVIKNSLLYQAYVFHKDMDELHINAMQSRDALVSFVHKIGGVMDKK